MAQDATVVADAVTHPLDALTDAEIKSAVVLLNNSGHVDNKTLYPAMTLIEPPKDFVRAWKKGDAIPRRMLAILRSKAETFEAELELTAQLIERFSGKGKTNGLKQHPSLWLNSPHDARSILASDDAPQMRAVFSTQNFWVSKNKLREIWAAGLYPNRSKTDEGLPRFVEDHESVVDEDLVVWYTMGFRYVTRPEDSPILPTFWHEMVIRPAFFFDMDPAMTFNSGRTEAVEETP